MAEKDVKVAIPSNRVNVSYFLSCFTITGLILDVAIPSNRVNVSYIKKKMENIYQLFIIVSQSPQIGSMFLT